MGFIASITHEVHCRLRQMLQIVRAAVRFVRLYKVRPGLHAGVHRTSTSLSGVLFAPIRKHIDHLAVADRFLQPLPVVGVIQLAMQLGK